MKITTDKLVISTLGSSAVSNRNYDLPFVSPSNHDEVDARILLHAKHAACAGIKKY